MSFLLKSRAGSLPDRLRSVWTRSLDRAAPRIPDPSLEDLRLSQLITGFAIIGGVFALAYAAFYLWIGHALGSVVILANSMVFSVLPAALLRRGRTAAAANWFLFALLSMFFWLSLLEGGVSGHAVAWLATLPVCAMLLLAGRGHAVLWSLAAAALVAVFSGLEVAGVDLTSTYPPGWHGWVTVIGYVGLALFMLSLGSLAEFYRRSAMDQRDRAQASLKEAVEKLTRLNREKNEFLGIAAHDLNNPLSVVLGYSQMLEEGVDLETVRDFASQITASTRRMQNIIRDVLDVNRIESGEYPMVPSDRPVAPRVADCVARHRGAGEHKGLRWDVEIGEATAHIDAGALDQVLDNLVSNAVKYATPGGRIEVRLKVEEDEAVFSVFNEGRGFTPEDKAKLFARFAKLSTRPTGGESSTGLGLSITKKIVDAMGGRIVCESELDQGARFEVRLPGMEPALRVDHATGTAGGKNEI